MFIYQKKPHKNAEPSQKHKNIDMKRSSWPDDLIVNILAFFNVVASSQISPHFPVRAAKIDIFSDMQTILS